MKRNVYIGLINKSNTSSEITISNNLEIDDSSDISRDVDDAVLHVISTKMYSSTLPNQIMVLQEQTVRILYTSI